MSRSGLGALLLPLAILAACRTSTPREAVEYLEIGQPYYREGTNLPRWAACLFPHQANPSAVRRAQPCPADSKATAVHTSEQVAGCWLITGEDGRPLDDRGFFSAPVRLMNAPSRQMNEDGLAIRSLASPRDSIEAGMFYSYWEFAPPDSVAVIRTTGFTGMLLSFRVRGDSMVGMAQAFYDVITMSMDTVDDRVPRLAARRIPCPPGG